VNNGLLAAAAYSHARAPYTSLAYCFPLILCRMRTEAALQQLAAEAHGAGERMAMGDGHSSNR
jgi:hypothetical protein